MASSRDTGSGSSGSGLQSQSCSSPSQRPSYFDFSSIAGLHPPEHTFDEAVIRKLDPELFDETACSEAAVSMLADDEKLKTFLRIRPVSDKSVNNGCGSSMEIKDSETVLAYANRKHFLPNANKRKFEFKFTKVLGPSCGQSAVYEECVNPVVEKFLRHEDCLIFSYGATNSGKTYTMQGYGTEYGIIPRTLDAIFSRLNDRLCGAPDIRPHLYNSFHKLSAQEVEALGEKRKKIISDANIKQELMNSYRLTTSGFSDRSGASVQFVGGGPMYDINTSRIPVAYSLWVSYAELYNERVYDLLDNTSIGKTKRRKELKLMQDRNGCVYIKDLTELPVTSDEEAYRLFLAGRKNLQFASTQMNQNSSRSHSFFTIRVVCLGVDGTTTEVFPKTVHRMTFCDLAGMERANQTENKGSRLQESGNINNSLTVLLKVIRVLREKQLNNNGGALETIPFRESKLTHIFKSFFTASTHICMLVNVNPDPAVADSTIQVLQNSAVASNVIVFRPMDLNQQSQHAQGLAAKPPVQKDARSERLTGDTTEKCTSTEDESDSGSDEYAAETVVAPKTLFQKLKLLEHENAKLKYLLDKSEAENNRLREEAVKAIVQQGRQWSNRLEEARIVDENVFRRRVSLLRQELSPGNRCRRCVAPVSDMDDIDETFEEMEAGEDEEDDDVEGEGESGNEESDKEN